MAKIVKAEDKYEYYDVVEDLNSTDEARMPTRRVGDAHLVESKVVFMPSKTRTYQTAGDMAVPVDEWLTPDGGEGAVTPAPKNYSLEEDVDGNKRGGANFLTPGESETVRPADFKAPTPSNILKRAPMFGDIINGQNGDGVDAADRFTSGR